MTPDELKLQLESALIEAVERGDKRKQRAALDALEALRPKITGKVRPVEPKEGER